MGAVHLKVEIDGDVADATLTDPALWQAALAGFLANILAIPAVMGVAVTEQHLEKTGS